MISAHLRHKESGARVATMAAVNPAAPDRNLYVAGIGVTYAPAMATRLMPEPVLLVEIINPENYKLVRVGVAACKLVPTLQEIVVLDGLHVCAALHRRNDRGEWDDPEYLFPDDCLDLRCIGIKVPINRIYGSVDLQPEPPMINTEEPPHPGVTIARECLERNGLSVDEAAVRLGVARSYFADVVAGLAGINADLAVRLAVASHSSAEDWLELQSEYDLAQVRRQDMQVERLGPPLDLASPCNDYWAEPGILLDVGSEIAQPFARNRNPPMEQREPFDPPEVILRSILERVERNGAETDERLRVLADAVERIVERLDAAPSRPRLLAPAPEVRPRERRGYTILIEGPEGSHTVLFPDLPHLTAHGPTYKQAVALATIVVEQWAMQELAAGRELPEARDPHYIINDPKFAAVLRAGALPKVVMIKPDDLRERLRAPES